MLEYDIIMREERWYQDDNNYMSAPLLIPRPVWPDEER